MQSEPHRKTDVFSPLYPRRLGDKYLLLSELGSGGMATIHLALTRGLGGGRACAVKTVAYGAADRLESAFSERFIEEAKAVSNLGHDNIVFVFDSGVVERELYLAMELLEGITLAQLMAFHRQTKTSLSLGLSMFVVLEILSGLQHVHDAGLVHGDVSPSNIMITTAGAIKLLDFGLARSISQPGGKGATSFTMKFGKEGYVSPEQYLGSPVSAPSDLFSVAVILWELLAGRALIEKGNRQKQFAFIAPTSSDFEIPQELTELLRIATANEPSHRFATALEFHSDLARYLAAGDYRKKLSAHVANAFAGQLKQRHDDSRRLLDAGRSEVKASPPASASVGPMNAAADYVGSVLLGRYHVTRLLGQGAMGAVFEAEHRSIGRKVAVKIPFFRGNNELRTRFIREAQASNRINDAHVVAVTDAGETPQGDAFVVMEFVDGENLEAFVHARAPLPFNEALTISIQVARALEAAHAAGVIHRDLKPANIMVTSTKDGLRAKVLDFGIARMLERSGDAAIDGLTVEQTSLGTPAYMAPEQFAGGGVDGRADVYAAAIVLYEMLAARLPFVGETAEVLLDAKRSAKPTPATQLDQPGLKEALAKALSPDPKDRQPDAGTWRRQLEGLRPDRRRGPASGARWLWVVVPTVALLIAIGIFFAWGGMGSPKPLVNSLQGVAKIEAVASPIGEAGQIAGIGKSPTAPAVQLPDHRPAPRKLAAHSQWKSALLEAETSFKEGDTVQALLHAKKAARLGAGVQAFLLQGRINLVMGENAAAESAFRAALVHDPGNLEAIGGLKKALDGS
jgi:eukaryotic-like serine/threonine-protein kinase